MLALTSNSDFFGFCSRNCLWFIQSLLWAAPISMVLMCVSFPIEIPGASILIIYIYRWWVCVCVCGYVPGSISSMICLYHSFTLTTHNCGYVSVSISLDHFMSMILLLFLSRLMYIYIFLSLVSRLILFLSTVCDFLPIAISHWSYISVALLLCRFHLITIYPWFCFCHNFTMIDMLIWSLGYLMTSYWLIHIYRTLFQSCFRWDQHMWSLVLTWVHLDQCIYVLLLLSWHIGPLCHGFFVLRMFLLLFWLLYGLSAIWADPYMPWSLL